VENTSFIQYGYWDSLNKGLLTGENLSLDLKRMEVAYLEKNRRELEITKHISLLQLDPMTLIALKETGSCEINLPEALFDLDFPGHYFRRIKSVSLTIPCVVGPYSSVNCTLTLLKHSYRKASKPGARQVDSQGNPADDLRFSDSSGMIQSIVTSSAQNDSGLFELNFRDERYLPFEGTGAISTWRLELSGKWKDSSDNVVDLAQFDFASISDAILHLRYTARDGGTGFRDATIGDLQQKIAGMMKLAEGRGGFYRLFSLRHEFPTEWNRFITQADSNGKHIQDFSFAKDRFPFFFQGRTIKISAVDLFGILKPQVNSVQLDNLKVTTPVTGSDSSSAEVLTLSDASSFGNLVHKTCTLQNAIEVKTAMNQNDVKVNWHFEIPRDGSQNIDQLEDILVVCRYQI
jgi:hypothetical protein